MAGNTSGTLYERKEGREMAKKAAKMTDTLELVKPYLERALKDEDFRNDLKDALG